MSKAVYFQNVVLMIIAAAIAIAPLIFIKDTDFSGADGAAETMITEINADYVPWASPVIEPPGGETESLLFSLQSALGAGVIFYCIGYLKGKQIRTYSNSTFYRTFKSEKVELPAALPSFLDK